MLWSCTHMATVGVKELMCIGLCLFMVPRTHRLLHSESKLHLLSSRSWQLVSYFWCCSSVLVLLRTALGLVLLLSNGLMCSLDFRHTVYEKQNIIVIIVFVCDRALNKKPLTYRHCSKHGNGLPGSRQLVKPIQQFYNDQTWQYEIRQTDKRRDKETDTNVDR